MTERTQMNIDTHNAIVTELIDHLNQCIAEHKLSGPDCMVVLESIVSSALVSSASSYKEFHHQTQVFFSNVHDRVNTILEAELKKKELH